MASTNGASTRVGDPENSLEKIKRQLASGSGRSLLQGPLLKRSETLRKWNERWVILDPTTGKMEYKTRRNEPTVKGTITFDENSTIAISPVNFNGLPKYDGCCFYIGTPQKKDYFLCAETPGAARAWVSTLHAAQLVLKAHKEAVNSLSGNGSAKLGTVATVVAAANSTAQECSKEIEAAMQISLRNALGTMTNRITDGPMDDLSIMKETLRVKDEELQNLARDLRARDSTIRDIADKLSETAEAAEAAASAAHTMDEQRRIACAEIERINKESTKQLKTCVLKGVHIDTVNEVKGAWTLEKSGIFSIKLYFLKLIDDSTPIFVLSNLIWKTRVPSKVKMMAWALPLFLLGIILMMWFRSEDQVWLYLWIGVSYVKMLQKVLITYLFRPEAFFLCSKLVRTFKLSWVALPTSFSVLLEKF